SRKIRFAGLSHRGRVRRRNEDNWYGDPHKGLFIVADGMSLHPNGEVAARMVVETLPQLLTQSMPTTAEIDQPEAVDGVRGALCEVSNHIREYGRRNAGSTGLGATVVMLLIGEQRAIVGHLGDSRLYRLRAEALELLTHDHSIVQYLIDLGELTEEQAGSHPARGRISRFMGMSEEVLPDVTQQELVAGDRLLLCSDGLTKMLPDRRIADLLLGDPEPESLCRTLVAEANNAGGEDNITAVVADWMGTDSS
ncbi:MAG: serine/threonine-protein phosphatase, partial [Rhodobacteraceae bacterium]|nr:serine/threonine-protein phosphatase [Paracoccaceae bacterium]